VYEWEKWRLQKDCKMDCKKTRNGYIWNSPSPSSSYCIGGYVDHGLLALIRLVASSKSTWFWIFSLFLWHAILAMGTKALCAHNMIYFLVSYHSYHFLVNSFSILTECFCKLLTSSLYQHWVWIISTLSLNHLIVSIASKFASRPKLF